MIKNVIFDIGKVLVSFDWDKLAKEIGFSDDDLEIMRVKVIGDRWNEFDRGVMSEKETIKYIQEVLPGLEDKFAELWYRIDEAISVYSYTDDWIRELKDRGLNVFLLSNFPKDLFIKEEKEKFNFAKMADGKVISAFVKLIKPDPEIYRYLLKEYDLKAEECVFIDDRQQNVETAIELGFHGIQFTAYGEAREKLEKLLS